MLGHVAQSVGGALPGGSGPVGLLLQKAVTDPTSTDVVAPQGASFAFIEALGQGGGSNYTSGAASSGNGAAGEDKIIAVTAGDVLTCVVGRSTSGTGAPSTISLNGTGVLSAAGGLNAANGQPASTTTPGKYPGERGVSDTATTTVRAKGGGRLAGPAGVGVLASGSSLPGGAGSGALTPTSNGSARGPSGMIVVSFFTSYDAALAFANSQYNGAWVPT